MIFKKLNESDEKTVSQIVPGVKFEDVEGARYEVIARDGMMATIKSEKEDDHNLFNGTNTINLKKMLDGGNLDNLFYKIHSTEMDYSNESKKRMKHIKLFESFVPDSTEGLQDCAAMFPKQYNALVKEKGQQWVSDNKGTVKDPVNEMSSLVYFHFYETDLGKHVWKSREQSEAKVDRIVDAIDMEYVDTDNPVSFTENEWNEEIEVKLDPKRFAYDVAGMTSKISLSSTIYEMVSDGVF